MFSCTEIQGHHHFIITQDDMLHDLDGMLSNPSIAVKALKEYGGVLSKHLCIFAHSQLPALF